MINVFTLVLLFCFTAFQLKAQEHEFTNSLIDESSPYLLQHAHNPVNWHAWSEKTLQKAKIENKMLLISIGYSACHWCHVMEHESFEDTAIANLMNDNFICIKVDREERPDIDKIYMNAAQLINGSGGWPLNAFALSDGRPFFAGTYYSPDKWIKMLKYIINEHATSKNNLEKSATQLAEGIQSINLISLNDTQKVFSIDSLNLSYAALISQSDLEKGGGFNAPKFPTPTLWKSLLQYSYLNNESAAIDHVNATLKNICYGGIYDQLGGGFSRYATDVNWNIPHFEKMLYDNAQLVELYTLAWQKTKNPEYKKVVFETLDYVDKYMVEAKGGFFSSLDADSEGEEGKYYIWTSDEIEVVLKNDAPLFMRYFNIKENGNWEEDKNILYRQLTDYEIASQEKISEEDLLAKIESSKRKLLDVRDRRVLPGIDDKVLTSWNALMLKGYIQAYRTFGEKRHLKSAKKNAKFILKYMIQESGEIMRNYKKKKVSISGFMDDYANVISSFIDLYEATFEEKWLIKANELTQYTRTHFQDTSTKMFMYSSQKSNVLISNEVEIYDQVIPSSNSEMAINLIRLGHYFANEDYLKTAEQMVLNVQDKMHENSYFLSNWSRAEMFLINTPFEVAITGRKARLIRHQLDQNYLPFVLFYGAKKKSSLELLEGKFIKGQTTIYVCKNKSCKAPTTSTFDALEQMKF